MKIKDLKEITAQVPEGLTLAEFDELEVAVEGLDAGLSVFETGCRTFGEDHDTHKKFVLAFETITDTEEAPEQLPEPDKTPEPEPEAPKSKK